MFLTSTKKTNFLKFKSIPLVEHNPSATTINYMMLEYSLMTFIMSMKTILSWLKEIIHYNFIRISLRIEPLKMDWIRNS